MHRAASEWSCPGNQRAGVTQLELLVALAIIGLLLAMLIPAVQSSRASSRRMACANNLRQIGQALHNFEGNYKRLPKFAHTRCVVVSYGSSLHAELLEFLEQPALSHAVRTGEFETPEFFKPPLVPTHLPWAPVALEPVPVFRCPADPASFVNNYRFCLTGKSFFPWDGPFGGHGQLSEITDGLSNTAAASEKLMSNGSLEWNPRTDGWYTGLINDESGPGPTVDELLQTCGMLTGPPIAYHAFAGYSWMPMGIAHTDYNHFLTPNHPTPDCFAVARGPAVIGNPWNLDEIGSARATSEHPGGVNVLYMDGRVSFAANSVDRQVWRALATRAGRD